MQKRTRDESMGLESGFREISKKWYFIAKSVIKGYMRPLRRTNS